MCDGIVACTGNLRAPVYPARPRWDDVAIFYPAENSALGIVGHSISSFKGTDRVSAIRISIALIQAGMKRSFSNASRAISVGDIVLQTHPDGTENLMYRSKFFANVEDLKNWLLRKDIWNGAEDGVNGVIISNTNRTLVTEKMKDRSGVIIIKRNDSNYASLWDIDKIVDGGDIIDGDTVYFWELEKGIEHYQNIDDARMAAAKKLLRCVYGYTEYCISIFKIDDNHFCLSSMVIGQPDRAIPSLEREGHVLAAIVHTHAESKNATRDEKLSAKKLSAMDKVMSFCHNASISLVTSDKKMVTVTAKVNRNNEVDAWKRIRILEKLAKLSEESTLNSDDEDWLKILHNWLFKTPEITMGINIFIIRAQEEIEHTLEKYIDDFLKEHQSSHGPEWRSLR